MTMEAESLKSSMKECPVHIKERVRISWRDYMASVLASGANVDDAAHVADRAVIEELERFGEPRLQT